MPRSALIALVVAGALIAGLLGVDHHWHWLRTFTRAELITVLSLEILGVALVAVSVSRIVDPELSIPILIWVVGGVVFILYLIVMIMSPRTENDQSSSSLLDSNSSSSSTTPSKGMGLGWAITATILSLCVYATGIGLAFAFGPHAAIAATKVAKQPPPAPPGAPIPTTPTPPPAPKDITDAPDLAAAIAIARPALSDTRDAPSAGTKQLARYAAAKLHFADVAVAKNETSLELVEKDPSAEVGKRMCAAGVLARIEKVTVDGTVLHSARLVTSTGDALEMFAVGGTGDLVKRKQARFCGVVTGRLDVDRKPATFAVGMFELPAEKR